MTEKICVLGAGIQGVLSALELAERGRDVVIYDKANAALTGASLQNEGKIHLGYIFAKDLTDRTAMLMAEGASLFGPLIDRWWPQQEVEAGASSNFDYLVMRGSLEDANWLARRYERIDDIVAEKLTAQGRSYLGVKTIARARRMDRHAVQSVYNPNYVDAVFQTHERAINTVEMARALSGALAAHPKIECRFDTRVDGVAERADGSFSVAVEGRAQDGPYRHVVNALWTDRLKVDATLGITTTRPHMFRMKIASRIQLPTLQQPTPSSTMVLGPFGDFVWLPGGSCYLSWYPSGCIKRSFDLAPPPDWAHISDAEIAAADSDILREISLRIPSLGDHIAAVENCISVQGIIFCWGETDVDDPDSELHLRRDVGPRSYGRGYHSVDTGKLTLAPLFAAQLAERICPK